MLKHFKIFFIHSKHNYNVEIYRCTCAERSQHFFDLNIRRRFFFYWTQRVLSLFPPFVGVLVFCEQKATLMTIHKMQKWKMISLVFFYSFNCNMISEMNGWHIVLWTLGISSIFLSLTENAFVRWLKEWIWQTTATTRQLQSIHTTVDHYISALIESTKWFYEIIELAEGFTLDITFFDSRFILKIEPSVENKWTKSKENNKILSQVSWDHMLRTKNSYWTPFF